MKSPILVIQLVIALGVQSGLGQNTNRRRLGRFTEVYAWKQISYNIDGEILDRDRISANIQNPNSQSPNWNQNLNSQNPIWNQSQNPNRPNQNGQNLSWNQNTNNQNQNWNNQYPNRNQNQTPNRGRPGRFGRQSFNDNINFNDELDEIARNQDSNNRGNSNEFVDAETRYGFSGNQIYSSSSNPQDESNSFFVQYNNVPMGAERVGNRLFVTLPRRRYGIPSTLNYLDLERDTSRSPGLRPYPNFRESQSLVSVYRTRADECGRLWMVDTGLLELPVNPQQVQPPAIVVFDLRTDRQILRYQLKESDLPSNNTPTGLASITVDTSNGCNNAFAYIPDLTTYGIIVYSLRENDSWRVTHNYMHFNPIAANLNIGGQRFQWNDGIFSITLGTGSLCRTAYFHPLVSTQEFSVQTCVLNNRTASTDPQYWTRYDIIGERGPNTQSTMHDLHMPSGAIFFTEVGRNAVSCWNTGLPLTPRNVAMLASDGRRLSYPADLHVTNDEVWVIANCLPRFSYARLDPNEDNFFIYRGTVQDLIAGTVCDAGSYRASGSGTTPLSSMFPSRFN